MRISLLEKREDFYRILQESLNKSSYVKVKNISSKKFIINKYLNFIATKTINSSVFQNLVNEYSNSLVWWKKIIQKIYVRLAISKVFRKLFGHGIIELPANYEKYLILGGNHRLRLFSKELKFSILILKKNERLNYLKNDIAIRTDNFMSYAPSIYEYGEDWLKEEYFVGKPLNRLNNQEKMETFKEDVIKSHLEELLLPTKKAWTKEQYAKFINEEIDFILDNEFLKNVSITKKVIKSLLSELIDTLTNDEISVSWSHGDFQMANVLIRDNQFKVIDWESANKRFYLYDIYTLAGGIRAGVSLKRSIERFIEKISFSEKVKMNKDIINLLLIEELRFSINEEYSENFYTSGLKTKQICESIQKYLND